MKIDLDLLKEHVSYYESLSKQKKVEQTFAAWKVENLDEVIAFVQGTSNVVETMAALKRQFNNVPIRELREFVLWCKGQKE